MNNMYAIFYKRLCSLQRNVVMTVTRVALVRHFLIYNFWNIIFFISQVCLYLLKQLHQLVILLILTKKAAWLQDTECFWKSSLKDLKLVCDIVLKVAKYFTLQWTVQNVLREEMSSIVLWASNTKLSSTCK